MIIILGRDQESVSVTARALEGLGGLVVVPGIEWVPPFLEDAEAVVLVAERHGGDPTATAQELRRAMPGIPLFVVLPASSDRIRAMRALRAVATDVVVEDRVRDLRGLMARGAARDPLTWLHTEITLMAPGSTLAGQIADLLCNETLPPRTVRRLASSLGLSEATLRRRWRGESASAPNLHVLLDWALVCGWLQVARELTVGVAAEYLRVDSRTLERATRRLGLGTPRVAAADPPAVLVRVHQSFGRGSHPGRASE